MQRRPFPSNRQNPKYQWVPKSSIASSSSAKPPALPDAPSSPPPPGKGKGKGMGMGRGKGKGKRRHRRSSKKGGERRNWAEMPSDALSVIFEKLGPIEVMFSAQAVCRSWRRLAHEKGIWRKVDFRIGVWNFYDQDCDLAKMARTAVDRSVGLLEEFSIEEFGNDDILQYMAQRSPGLKCLRLVSCYDVSDEGLVEALRKLPLLEEIYIAFHSLDTEENLTSIGKLCPLLRSFHLNVKGCKYNELQGDEDVEAIGIAKSMPMLQEVQLFGNQLTNEGLLAILDGCPHLESLDLRQCFNVKMDEALKKRCSKIKNLRLPYDSTAGYPFDSTFIDLRKGHSPYDDYEDYYDDDFDDYGVYDDDDFDDYVYEDFFSDYEDNFGLIFPDLAAMHNMFRESIHSSD